MANQTFPPQPEAVAPEYGGQWVAWDEENVRIVASGESYDDAKRAAESAGVARPILEFIPPSDAAFIGGP